MLQTKKNYTLILLFFFVGYVSAQNCTFSKDETDKFSNTRVLHTKPINVIEKTIKQKKIYTIKKIEMQAKYENNASVLTLYFYFDLGLTMANTSSKLILLLSNGAKIELPCIQNLPSQERRGSSLVQFYDFAISEENFNVLLEYDIEDVRLASQLNPVDFSISPTVKTSELFNCINKNK